MTLTKKNRKKMKAAIFNESGKGYWMEGVGCIMAEGENRPSRPGHIVVLNDQGGSVINVSETVTATLRAQDHGHPPVACYPVNLMVATRGGRDDMRTCFGIEPVICFEPGIARREGSESRFINDKSPTLRAVMGDNKPAVCYAIEGNSVDRNTGKNGRGWCENVSPTLNTQDRHSVCYSVDCRNLYMNHEKSGTLQAKSGGGFSYNYLNPVLYEEK